MFLLIFPVPVIKRSKKTPAEGEIKKMYDLVRGREICGLSFPSSTGIELCITFPISLKAGRFLPFAGAFFIFPPKKRHQNLIHVKSQTKKNPKISRKFTEVKNNLKNRSKINLQMSGEEFPMNTTKISETKQTHKQKLG